MKRTGAHTQTQKKQAKQMVIGALFVALLFTSAPAQSATYDDAAMKSVESNWCDAEAEDGAYQQEDTSSLTVKAEVFITEWSKDEDQWWAELKVDWDAWPEEASNPGDEEDSRTFDDTRGGDFETYDEELKVDWASDEFEMGTYEATISIEITWSEREWDSGDNFNQRCSESDTADLTIEVCDPDDLIEDCEDGAQIHVV